MNLADYSKMDKERPSNSGEFLTFNHGETKYLRFLYESGGDRHGEDIKIIWKKWDDIAKKFIYEEGKGSRRTILNVIEYNEDGSNPKHARLDVSAYMCETTFLPAWKNYPRIIDGVWKVTCSNPKTKELSYSLFPVMGADAIKYPIIEAEAAPQTEKKKTKESAPAAPTPKKKYWE